MRWSQTNRRGPPPRGDADDRKLRVRVVALRSQAFRNRLWALPRTAQRTAPRPRTSALARAAELGCRHAGRGARSWSPWAIEPPWRRWREAAPGGGGASSNEVVVAGHGTISVRGGVRSGHAQTGTRATPVLGPLPQCHVDGVRGCPRILSPMRPAHAGALVFPEARMGELWARKAVRAGGPAVFLVHLFAVREESFEGSPNGRGWRRAGRVTRGECIGPLPPTIDERPD